MFSPPFGNNGYFAPLIIGQFAKNQSEIVIRNVTMKNATKRGSTTLTHLLKLSNIQSVEITDVTIMNNRYGALTLFDSVVVLRGHYTLSNNSAIKAM